MFSRAIHFKPGDRVELHPATDRWMQGDRFGTVCIVDQSDVRPDFDRVSVALDKSGKTLWFGPHNVRHAEACACRE